MQGGGFLVDGGAVQGKQGDALFVGLSRGTLPEGLGQALGVGREVLEEDLLLPEITLDASARIEESGFASEA